MKKNDVVKLNITGTTAEGAGVGHVDSLAVFVPMTAPGDVVEAVIIKLAKSYAVGKLLKVITPSPDRNDNDCAVFSKCGGCVFRHISYDAECRIKRQRIADCLSRIGGINIEVGFTPAESTVCYRNKAQYPVANGETGLEFGFYAARSHRIVKCSDCSLQPAEFELVLDAVAEFAALTKLSAYDETTRKGLLRHVYIRRAEVTKELMVCLVINGRHLPHGEKLVEILRERLGEQLKTVVLNINTADTNVILSDECKLLYGDGYINDELCSVKVRLSALSFYQVNHTMAQRLYQIAREFVPNGSVLLDLYCGAGTIGLSMADKFEQVIGVEVIAQAVEDAEFNAKSNSIENARFICADAHEAAKVLKAEGLSPDTVIVDPPRKGLSQGMPEFIAKSLNPGTIVYISCDPATLARDLAEFVSNGYSVECARGIDLFPRTSHVETVALLHRQMVK